MLISDLLFAGDPWVASVPFDVTALITRFPIVSNGYQQSQVAADIGRSARYVRIHFPPGTTRALALEKVDIRGDVSLSARLFQCLDPLVFPVARDPQRRRVDPGFPQEKRRAIRQ